MGLLLALISTLSIRKLISLLRSQYAFIMARLWGIDIKASYPPYVSIEASSRCNLKCPECITGSQELMRAIGDISLDNFKIIVDKIYPYTIVLNLYMQGEPYLNKDLPQMIAYAKSKNLFVSLSTNAQRLPELSAASLPHHLIVSVDGATQESYQAYRIGGKLSKVISFVNEISAFKKQEQLQTPFIDLQFLVNRYNEGEQKATKTLFKGKYNHFVSKTMQIIHEENKEKFTPKNKCSARYMSKTSNSKACYKMLSTAVFTQDGQLALCCMDKNAEFSAGNILTEDFISLLNNKKAKAYREMLIKEKTKVHICNNCPFA